MESDLHERECSQLVFVAEGLLRSPIKSRDPDFSGTPRSSRRRIALKTFIRLLRSLWPDLHCLCRILIGLIDRLWHKGSPAVPREAFH